MTIVLPRLAFSLVLLAAAPLSAQGAVPAEKTGDVWGGAEIVVTGRNSGEVDGREVTRQARAITRETNLRHEPIARFADRACPGVIGMKLAHAQTVVARFRLVAGELNIPLADETTCRPNIIIGLSKDPAAYMKAYNARTLKLSRNLTAAERRELTETAQPVKVFSIVDDRMRNGQTLARKQNLAEVPVGLQEGGQSLISNGIRRAITSAMVIFDTDAVEGTSLRQIADYAVMRVFARTRDASGAKAPDSILSLFDPNASPPDGLTDFDRAFLSAIYEGSPYGDGQHSVQRVAQVLKRQLSAND
ncbi:hypothetical protein [Croceibacterium aestuarii]|uniref:hypothetical protein n=1 Tax=Croceibacterium aestuarii TaxID=3064139 RepID=UPI00272E843A|nr:hypothetical protein [Croceibacterium sp. D39]